MSIDPVLDCPRDAPTGQVMADRDKEKLDRQFGRFESRLPDSISRFIRWLREASSRWVRIPLAIVLICGGLFGFLPVLGLWMLPLGFLLLAEDLPFLRKPTRGRWSALSDAGSNGRCSAAEGDKPRMGVDHRRRHLDYLRRGTCR